MCILGLLIPFFDIVGGVRLSINKYECCHFPIHIYYEYLRYGILPVIIYVSRSPIYSHKSTGISQIIKFSQRKYKEQVGVMPFDHVFWLPLSKF